MNNKKQEPTTFDFRALALAWRLGYTIALPLILFALGGRLIDRWLDTTPWFLLTGILLSIIASTYSIFRITVPILNGDNSDNQQEKKQ